MKNSVTQAHVTDQIVDVSTQTIFEKVTVVSVRLKNGFVLVESAGAVDKANYSEEIGRGICLDHIKNKIWELEGYHLSSQLAEREAISAIAEAAFHLCATIEKIPGSLQMTDASIEAAALHSRLDLLVRR